LISASQHSRLFSIAGWALIAASFVFYAYQYSETQLLQELVVFRGAIAAKIRLDIVVQLFQN